MEHKETSQIRDKTLKEAIQFAQSHTDPGSVERRTALINIMAERGRWAEIEKTLADAERHLENAKHVFPDKPEFHQVYEQTIRYAAEVLQGRQSGLAVV